MIEKKIFLYKLIKVCLNKCRVCCIWSNYQFIRCGIFQWPCYSSMLQRKWEEHFARMHLCTVLRESRKGRWKVFPDYHFMLWSTRGKFVSTVILSCRTISIINTHKINQYFRKYFWIIYLHDLFQQLSP